MRSLNPSLQAGRCQMATPKLPLRPLRSLSVPVRAQASFSRNHPSPPLRFPLPRAHRHPRRPSSIPQAPKDAANDPPPAPGLRTVREIDSAVPSPQEPTEASGVAPATPPPSGFVTAVMKPLKDFGFGKKSIWEGGVGLFILSGEEASSEGRERFFSFRLFDCAIVLVDTRECSSVLLCLYSIHIYAMLFQLYSESMSLLTHLTSS